MHTGMVIAGEGFVWTDKANSKVRFGARIQQLKIWETDLLVIQCAVKNESTEVCFVPVTYADMHIRIPTVEYWLSVSREGDEPLGHREVPITSSGTKQNLFEVKEPRRFIRLAPGETFRFSPITTDMGNGPALTKMSVKTRLKIEAPLAGFPAIEVTRIASRGFEDSAGIDSQKVAVGEWSVVIPYEIKK